jgi:hypothetical protein
LKLKRGGEEEAVVAEGELEDPEVVPKEEVVPTAVAIQ